MNMSRINENIESLMDTLTAMVEHSWVLPSCSHSSTTKKCYFHGLFSAVLASCVSFFVFEFCCLK